MRTLRLLAEALRDAWARDLSTAPLSRSVLLSDCPATL